MNYNERTSIVGMEKETHQRIKVFCKKHSLKLTQVISKMINLVLDMVESGKLSMVDLISYENKEV